MNHFSMIKLKQKARAKKKKKKKKCCSKRKYRHMGNVNRHARIKIFFVNKHGLVLKYMNCIKVFEVNKHQLLKIVSISSSRHLFFVNIF